MRRWLLFLLLLLAPSLTWAQVSSLTNLTPPNTVAGSTDLPLQVYGGSFVPGATINWNGIAQSTSYVNASLLTATINTALLAAAGAAQVTVTQSGYTSSSLIFQVLSPVVSNISYQPTSFTAGTATTVTVSGQGFNPTATIFFDWFPIATSFISSNTLSASVPSYAINGPGPHHVIVYNASVPAGRPSLRVQTLQGFGSQTTGTTSTQTITVSNISAAPITLGTPYRVLSGMNAADFTSTGGTCSNGQVLAVAASCTAAFTFTPSVLANEIAVVSIASNGIGNPQSVTFFGTGTSPAAPAVSLSPSGLLFGNQVQSTASNSITATFTNSGNASLTISGISASGANSADFTVGGTCTGSTVLSAGANCTITGVFTPSTTSTESANVNVTDNAVGSPHTLALHGTGVAAAAHNVVLTWSASTSSNLIGYNVYRGTVNGGPYALLTPSPISANGYTDTQVVHLSTYYYVITSVGTNPPYSPAESINSSQVSATIP